MNEVPTLDGEILFVHNDYCIRMLMVVRGSVSYSRDLRLRSRIGASFFDGEASREGMRLGVGTQLSEATLWTHWKNRGRAISDEPGILLALDSERFGVIAQKDEWLKAEAVIYARRFINMLELEEPSDVMRQFTDDLARRESGRLSLGSCVDGTNGRLSSICDTMFAMLTRRTASRKQ